MGNVQKKMRDENDKKVLKEKFGKKPKHRCPICHRFTMWTVDGKERKSFEVLSEMCSDRVNELKEIYTLSVETNSFRDIQI